MADAESILAQVVQDVPAGDGTQKALRTLSQETIGQVLAAGQVVDLEIADLDFRTTFTGPWICQILSVTFWRLSGGVEIPDYQPRDLMVGWVLGGRLHPIFEDKIFNGWSWSSDNQFHLGPGDQVFVRAKGEGRAVVAVRGIGR